MPNPILVNDVTKCFHLGDIFTGSIHGSFSTEEMLKQIRDFNGVVAYLADVHYENEKATSMDVFFLHSDNNYRIMSEEGVHWRFHEKNKIMQKML